MISFLFELDGHCDKKKKRCVDAEEEIQLETECHKGTFILTKYFSLSVFLPFLFWKDFIKHKYINTGSR